MAPSVRDMDKYVQQHLPNAENTNNSIVVLKSIKNNSNRRHALYTHLRKTKVSDPVTGKKYVRHGKKGQQIVRTSAIRTMRTRMNKSDIQTNKSKMLNKALKRFGVKNTLTALKGTKIPALRNGYLKHSRLKNADKIREEVSKLTQGQATLSGRPRTLGQGAAGLAVTCLSNDKCDKKYNDLVLKIADADVEWQNEVNVLTKLTKYMQKNPLKDPVAPKIIGSFKIDDRGFILMQHAAKVFPKATKAVEWRAYGRDHPRMSIVPQLKLAMKKLHAAGVLHGNMHDKNVWVAVFPKKIKVYFADFGRSVNFKAVDTLRPHGSTHVYGRMMDKPINLLSHPNNKNLSVMDDRLVMRGYEKVMKSS